MIQPSVSTIDATFDEARRRDPLFDEHALGVARLATAAGAHLGLTGPRLDLLAFAARVHDLGKALIPSVVMARKGPLDDEG